jgi:WD40 repeat protein
MLETHCPQCGVLLQFHDLFAGTKVRCPDCESAVAVPALSPRSGPRAWLHEAARALAAGPAWGALLGGVLGILVGLLAWRLGDAGDAARLGQSLVGGVGLGVLTGALAAALEVLLGAAWVRLPASSLAEGSRWVLGGLLFMPLGGVVGGAAGGALGAACYGGSDDLLSGAAWGAASGLAAGILCFALCKVLLRPAWRMLSALGFDAHQGGVGAGAAAGWVLGLLTPGVQMYGVALALAAVGAASGWAGGALAERLFGSASGRRTGGPAPALLPRLAGVLVLGGVLLGMLLARSPLRGRCAGELGIPATLAVSPDGRLAVTTPGRSPDSPQEDAAELWLWNLASGRLVRRLAGHTRGVRCTAFSPDGRLLLSGAGDGTMRLWDVDAGTQLKEFKPEVLRADGDGRAFRLAGQSFVGSLAFSPDGRCAVSSGGVLSGARFQPCQVLWDLQTGREVRRLGGSGLVAFSPAGDRLLSFGARGDVRLIDLFKGVESQKMDRPPGATLALGFAGKTPVLLSAVRADGGDHMLRLWDADTGRELRRFEGHAAEVSAAVISPDGRYVLSAAKDRTVRLWDLACGTQLACYFNYGPAEKVALAADGSALSTSFRPFDWRQLDSAPRLLRLWQGPVDRSR